MSESNNKEGVKVPWFFIGTILFAILLSLLFLNPDTSNSPTEVSEKESLSYSDTILVANDSIKDRLYAEYGLQVLKVNYDKYHNDWIFKLKNVSNRIIGDSKQLSLKLTFAKSTTCCLVSLLIRSKAPTSFAQDTILTKASTNQLALPSLLSRLFCLSSVRV